MEGPGHLQAHRADPALGGGGLGPLDRRDRARDHHLLGRVLVRDEQDVVAASGVAELLGLLGPDAEERAHRPGDRLAGRLHRPAANGHHRERIAEADHLRGDERRELAERVAGRADERHVLGPKDPERRDPAREERRLHELGRGERALVAATLDHVPPDRHRGLLEGRSALIVAGPGIGHAEELRPLPGEHHRDAHAASSLHPLGHTRYLSRG
jgi:hypothetical protein